MARGDFSIIEPNANAVPNVRHPVASGTLKSINAGEPIKSNDPNVVIMVDGDGNTSQKFYGIAKSDSTDTTTAAGEVYAFIPLPNLIYAGKTKVSTAVNTRAKIDALHGKRVVFDLTGTAWTIDSAAANAATNGIIIIDGDPVANLIYFMVSPQITFLDNPTTA